MELIALLITATNTIFLTVLLWKQTNKEQIRHEIEFDSRFEDLEAHETLKKQIKADRKKAAASKTVAKKRSVKKTPAKATARKKVSTTPNKAR